MNEPALLAVIQGVAARKADLGRRAEARPLLLPAVIVIGALAGAGLGFWIQYWAEGVASAIGAVGSPHNNWPSYIRAAFEFILLFAVASGFLALFLLCRLPRVSDAMFGGCSAEEAAPE